MVPGGMGFGVRLHDPLETLHVYIRRTVIEEIANELMVGDPAHAEIPPAFVNDDPVLGTLLRLVRICLEEEEDVENLLMVDQLARSIATRLMLKHSVSKVRRRPILNPALTPGPVLARAIEFMRANLERSISLDDIAGAVNYSPGHFARLFRKETGIPPHRFLVNLRLEQACDMLAGSKLPIAEIAYACGFSHQEHLTRFLRQRCKVTPAAFRKMQS